MVRDELKGVPTSPYTGIPGWETNPEEATLTALAGEVPEGGVIVELGSEYGRSAGAFARGSMKSVDIVSVDLFPKDHAVVGDLLAEYQANVGKLLLDGRRIGLMIGDSAEAAQHWPEGKAIDLLFIDAAHDYEAVRRDIAAWVPYLKHGGVVAFHDCAVGPDSHYSHHEVSRAVDEWKLAENGLFTERPQVDSLRVFDKGG